MTFNLRFLALVFFDVLKDALKINEINIIFKSQMKVKIHGRPSPFYK